MESGKPFSPVPLLCGMGLLARAPGHYMTMALLQGPCVCLMPCLAAQGFGGLGFFFFFFNFSLVYKTVVIHLHLLIHCLRLCYCPPMSSTNHCWKHKGKTGIGSSLCVLPNLSESIGRGNPRRTHPNDAGAEPFVAMVTGEMGPGMERGL